LAKSKAYVLVPRVPEHSDEEAIRMLVAHRILSFYGAPKADFGQEGKLSLD
jgi:hypothetical protein